LGQAPDAAATAGSLWQPAGGFGNLTADLKARQPGDVVTILVMERATAAAAGSTKSARSSSADYSIGALGPLTRSLGAWASPANLAGQSQLDGQGRTTRETALTTTLSAVVTGVLPNGTLVIEGAKTVQVNSEQQLVQVRGLVRPYDLTPGNLVRSDRIANLEIRINGKGVVTDSVRRPFFLYRILLGLLPF
jgi:flagellar L-ring protein precursor FlgH